MKYSLIVPAAALGEEKHHRHASMFAPLASEADAKRASPDTGCVPLLHDIEEHPQGMFEPAALCNGFQNAPVLSAAPIPPFYGCGNIWRPTSGGILRLGWGRAGAGMWVGRLEGVRMAASQTKSIAQGSAEIDWSGVNGNLLTKGQPKSIDQGSTEID